MTHTIAAIAFVSGWVACLAWRALDVRTIRSPLAAWRFAHLHVKAAQWRFIGWRGVRIGWRGVRIRFYAYLFGSLTAREYGGGFVPKGYEWRSWFVRITPWPWEIDT